MLDLQHTDRMDNPFHQPPLDPDFMAQEIHHCREFDPELKAAMDDLALHLGKMPQGAYSIGDKERARLEYRWDKKTIEDKSAIGIDLSNKLKPKPKQEELAPPAPEVQLTQPEQEPHIYMEDVSHDLTPTNTDASKGHWASTVLQARETASRCGVRYSPCAA